MYCYNFKIKVLLTIKPAASDEFDAFRVGVGIAHRNIHYTE